MAIKKDRNCRAIMDGVACFLLCTNQNKAERPFITVFSRVYVALLYSLDGGVTDIS